MTFNINETKCYNLFYMCFFLVLITIVINRGYIFTYDTNFYLSGFTNVQPAYTIFLFLIRKLSGSFFKEVTILIQLIYCYSAIVYFLNTIKDKFKFKFYINILLFLIITHPIYGDYSMCNKLVTESMAFSFFLLMLTVSINWYFLKRNLYMFLVVVFLVLLQLTRAQFLSISIALVLFVFYVWNFKELKRNIGLFFLIISVPLISGLLEKSIYGVVHKHYTSRQLGNVSVATLPFYLSEFEDFKLMPDNESKEFFLCAYTELEKKKLLASQLPLNSNFSEIHGYFFDNFPKIMNQTVQYEAKMMYDGEEQSFSVIYENATRIIGKTIKPLFLARPLKWFKVFYENLAFAYFSIIPVVLLLLFVVFLFLKRNKSILKYQSLLYFFSLLVLGNLFLISISTHTIRRFFMYFDVVIALIVILVLCNNTSIKKYIQTN